MNKSEFILSAVSSGYASKRVAMKYAKEKEVFADDDYIGVYRLNEEVISEEIHFNPKYRCYQGVMTTKRLRHTNPDNMNPK